MRLHDLMGNISGSLEPRCIFKIEVILDAADGSAFARGLCALVGRVINGILHFAIQAKLECGNFDVVELAPTVQCLTGNFRKSNADLPFLQFVLNAPASHCWVDSMQSEEGGRFYREQNRNMIVVGSGS